MNMLKTACLLILTSLLVIVAGAQSHLQHTQWLKAEQQARNSVILLNNSKQTIPIKNLKNSTVAVISDNDAPVFDSIARKYTQLTFFKSSPDNWSDLDDRLKFFNTIIVRISPETTIDQGMWNFIKQRQAIVVLQGVKSRLADVKGILSPLILCPLNTAQAASVTAQLIFGGVSAGKATAKGQSAIKNRLGYSVPEAFGINSDSLNLIDRVMYDAIDAKATPGGVVLIVKNGSVIFEKAYGHQTYAADRPLRTVDIYDLASVTKIAATTPAVMKLYEEGKLQLLDPVSKYVTRTRTIADKKDVTIRETMLHEAGYFPDIKHFEKLTPSDLQTAYSKLYPVKVADGYYLRASYFEEVMWPATLASPMSPRGKFVYSDISMYMMREVVEKITHRRVNEYLPDWLYQPLGLQTMGYLPRDRFDRSRIVPTTENDNWFRTMQLRGYVHDPGAAMAGGVSGHAGLFSNANDLAILYQVFLNKGTYGGQQYFKPATIALFTSRQSKVTERGLGFARPDPARRTVPGRASELSFGHTGYTGTSVWVDPAFGLICVILTNRVYPQEPFNQEPSQRFNVRGKVHEVVYRVIKN